jgi:two-component sensor histidine kinase
VISSGVPTQHDLHVSNTSFIIRVTPCTKSDGQISGAVLTFTNVTAFRASLDQAIYEREYTKAILNSVADPLVVLGAGLRIQTANRAFYSMFDVSREAIQGVPLDEVSKGALAVEPLVMQLKETLANDCPFQPFETKVDLPKAGPRTLSLHACQFALPRQSGPMIVLSFHDISARKRIEENIYLLAQEVDHRSKNLLAVVQATIHLTRADSIDALKEAIDGRIRALSNVHTLLAQSRWTGADLRTLVRAELLPYCGEETTRALIDGPGVILKPASAQSIAMMLHELTTNAVKYGALSVPAGHVGIRWSRVVDGKLVFRWTEMDGPPVKPPNTKGFGTRLLDQAIREQMNGEMRFDWRPEGLDCEVKVQA